MAKARIFNLGPYVEDQRKIIAQPPAIPLVTLEPGDRVGYALSTGFDRARRGTVTGEVCSDLIGVHWDGAIASTLVKRATVAKVGELTRAWSHC